MVELKNILLFEHVTVAKDCALALENLGFNVEYEPFPLAKEINTWVQREKPSVLMSVNLNLIILELSLYWKIPYIAWVIDTPVYQLYFEKVKQHPHLFLFVYDEMIAKDLTEKGYHNVHYLPVGANSKRLEGISVTENDQAKYQSDVSFLGSTGVENEYNRYQFEKVCGKKFSDEVLRLFQIQAEDPSKYFADSILKCDT